MPHRAGDALCFSASGVVTWGTYAADVAALRPRIAGASHVCNLLGDRYDFLIGLGAAMLNGQVSVLPSSAAPEATTAALGAAPSPLILGGAPAHAVLAPRMERIAGAGSSVDPAETLGALAASTAPIQVFTSGTTKLPECHLKTWSILGGGAAITDAILRQMGVGPDDVVLFGTTPHQHMYGLEATIFASLVFGYCTFRNTVFFPGDLQAGLVAARENGFGKVVLVTSPAHLRFLESTILNAPQIAGIVSATAPLPPAQAERLEARGDLPVLEIYGSTETGSLAIRRTAVDPLWQPMAGFSLVEADGRYMADAPHLVGPVPLGDRIDIAADGRFALLGRVGDMVSINGKRSSLAALEAVLGEVPGLLDGIVLHRRGKGEDRLAVVAVRDPADPAPEDDLKSRIRHRFHHHFDPVFAPKRIVFTGALPRSGTGKIPAAKIVELFDLARI